MANEVEIYEAKDLSGSGMALPVPLMAKQVLSIGGPVSAAFNRSTKYIRVAAIADARIEFSPPAGTDPTGAGMTILIKAGTSQDFEVVAGRKVIAVAA